MSYTIVINGSSIDNDNHTDDIDLKEFRTRKFDTLDITIINSTDDEAFDVDSEVMITIQGVSTYWILGADGFNRYSKGTFLYEHRLSLIECNLEGITLPNIGFRNKRDGVIGDGITYSVWDQLVRLREIAELKLISDTTRLWNYDTTTIPHLGMNLQAYTEGIKGKQITLNRPNARQALDKILQQIQCEIKMTSFNNVGVEFWNVKGDEIDETDLIIYKGNQNLEQYADRLDMFIENAITDDNLNKQAIVYPSVAWASVRGPQAFLTSDNFIMDVPYPIETVLKFEIYVKARMLTTPPSGWTIPTWNVDITELLTDENAYNGLTYNLAQTAGGYPDTVCRNNSVYYVKGGTKILGFHEPLDVFTGFSGTYFAYRHLLCYAYTKFLGGSPPIFEGDFNTTAGANFEDFMFRLTYVPRMNERLRIEKDNPLGTRSLFYNQDERLPDIEKQGNRLRDDVERLGNKQLTIAKYDVSYVNRIKRGDYLTRNGNDYIVDTAHWVGSKATGVSEAVLSKFSPVIDRDVSINTENRDTAVDVNNAVIRHVLYNEYMLLSYSVNTNNTLMTAAGLSRYNQFINNGTVGVYENPVEMCRFVHDGSAVGKILGCKSVGANNVLKFDFGFDNVNIAGHKTELLDGAWFNSYVKYVGDDYARLSDFEMKLFGEYAITSGTFADTATVSKRLPEEDVTLADVNDVYFENPSADRFNLLKDGSEVIKVTYQVSHFPDETSIIIGDKLCTENPLIVKDSPTVYLYKSNTKFEKGNFITQYDSKLLIINTGTPGAGEIKVTYSSGPDWCRNIVDDASSFYWAIGTDDQELFYAVNDLTEKTVYFNPRNKRS